MPGNPDLFLEDQPGGHHQLLLDDRDDQHPVLFAHWRQSFDWHAKGDALNRHILLLQLDLGDLVALLDTRVNHHPAALHLAFAKLELLFHQLDEARHCVSGHWRWSITPGAANRGPGLLGEHGMALVVIVQAGEVLAFAPHPRAQIDLDRLVAACPSFVKVDIVEVTILGQLLARILRPLC